MGSARGNRREAIFLGDDDRRFFLQALSEAATELPGLKSTEPRKVALAGLLWRHTTVPQTWLAERLHLRSAANVSQVLRRTLPAVMQKPRLLPAWGALDFRTNSPYPEPMSKKTYQRYTTEFKDQAHGLLRTGKPVAEVAADLSISTNLLYAWRNGAQLAQGGSEGLRAGGEQSAADALRELRRHNTRLQVENDILKKAAIILGSRPQPSSAR